MSNTSSTINTGISFNGLLTIVFITLKLTGYIDWSWIWVLSPLWIPIVFVISVFVIVIGLTILFSCITR